MNSRGSKEPPSLAFVPLFLFLSANQINRRAPPHNVRAEQTVVPFFIRLIFSLHAEFTILRRRNRIRVMYDRRQIPSERLTIRNERIELCNQLPSTSLERNASNGIRADIIIGRFFSKFNSANGAAYHV